MHRCIEFDTPAGGRLEGCDPESSIPAGNARFSRSSIEPRERNRIRDKGNPIAVRSSSHTTYLDNGPPGRDHWRRITVSLEGALRRGPTLRDDGHYRRPAGSRLGTRRRERRIRLRVLCRQCGAQLPVIQVFSRCVLDREISRQGGSRSEPEGLAAPKIQYAVLAVKPVEPSLVDGHRNIHFVRQFSHRSHTRRLELAGLAERIEQVWKPVPTACHPPDRLPVAEVDQPSMVKDRLLIPYVFRVHRSLS